MTAANRQGQILPTLGRIVLYRTDGRNGLKYDLPAVVVRTRASTDQKSIGLGTIKELPDDLTVDLFVMSVQGESYGEDAVPFTDDIGIAGSDPDGVPARSWRWPPRN